MVPDSEHRAHPEDPFLGAVVDGRYRLIGVLLPMERGAVYRAVEDPVGQEVALRTFVHGKPDVAAEEERFRREAETLRRLRSPGVVSVLSYGTAQGVHWAAFELVRAEALSQGLRRGPLAWNQALGLTLHLLAGLDAAHRVGILHGQLTPYNILVLQDEAGLRAQVAGLGSNRVFGFDPVQAVRQATSDRPHLTPGVVECMSPEQIEGQHEGPWSDVYSLGCVLYHMLSGRPPYTGPPEAILQAHLQGHPAPLEPAYPCPQEVLDVVARAMARAPAHRFPEARSAYEAISAILANPSSNMVRGSAAPGPGGPPLAGHPPVPPPTQVVRKGGAAPGVDVHAETVGLAQAPSAGVAGDPGSTMDIDLDELHELHELGGAESSPYDPSAEPPARPGGTMNLDMGDLQEVAGDSTDPSRPGLPAGARTHGAGGPPPTANLRVSTPPAMHPPGPPPPTGGFGAAAPPPTASFAAAGPPPPTGGFGAAPGPPTPPSRGPGRGAPTGGAQGYRPTAGPPLGAPATAVPRATSQPAMPAAPPPPTASPLATPPQGAEPTAKATLLVDVDEFELARLQEEFKTGAPKEKGATKKGAGLPLPAIIGLGALALALLVLIIAFGLRWVGGRPGVEDLDGGHVAARTALAILAELDGADGGIVEEGDDEPVEPLEREKTLDELRAEASALVGELTGRDREVDRKLRAMISRGARITRQLPGSKRGQAQTLLRDLNSAGRTRRSLGREIRGLQRALRRADESKLLGVLANGGMVRSGFAEVLGIAQAAYDELEELMEAERAPAEPVAVAAVEPPTVAPEPRDDRSAAPVAVAMAPTPAAVEVAALAPVRAAPARAGRDDSSAALVEIERLPPPSRGRAETPEDPELTSLISAVERTATPPPAAAPPPRDERTAVAAMVPAAGPTSEPAGAGFQPVVSAPMTAAPRPAGGAAATEESDEELLLRILGSQRDGPIVVSGESCPCDPRNVRAAVGGGGKALTECELRACEKVPPGTHHYSDINLNLASYFFRRRLLRREFAALHRATSYGKYKHDPQVLLAYIKVAVRLRRFRQALQAKDRFLFVQERLPGAARQKKVGEVFKVLAQAFEHQFYRQRERNPKSTDLSYLNRAIDYWERYADYTGDARRAQGSIVELKRLRSELEQE